MRSPARILVVDDDPINLDVLSARVAACGYDVLSASDGEQALATVEVERPDLLLLDVMMPKLDGFEVCRRLRADATAPFMPIILVTARGDTVDIVAGLEAGADEYLIKPVDHDALVARVRSMLRVKALHDTVRDQALQLSEWNSLLEERVERQVQDLERLGRLKRFLSPQLAELIVAGGEESLLESHRREIVAVACHLHGFAELAEAVEPEDVMAVLREYHAALGALVFQFEGTLERFAGDGLMVIFNDPVPLPDAAEKAVRMALAMRDAVDELAAVWHKKHGHKLGLGSGIAMGYVTLGKVGFEGRFDYAAVGTVTHLAARLADEAQAGQILANVRTYAAVDGLVDAELAGEVPLRGFARPVTAYKLLRVTDRSSARADVSPLSARELEVAALIALGLTNRGIGERLVVTERTVASHIEHILDKLGFSSRTQIGVWASEHRLSS